MNGNLYGTTSVGGESGSGCGGYGCGNAFELTPVGNGKWTEKMLHNFEGYDGGNPVAELTFDARGNLYGTTNLGGADNLGTIFELSPTGRSWNERVLRSFHGTDGYYPAAGVIIDRNGKFFGTTCCGGKHGFGTAFEFTR
jgi:uncharacterized repeat protein (TIGR03803 family)